MIKKEIQICGRPVVLGASALLPKIYRINFGKDMVADMNRLRKSFNAAQNLSKNATEEEREAAQLDEIDLTIFERTAWAMAYHADKEGIVPRDPDAWLESFDGVFSIYEVFPVILELWGINQKTTSVPAKK